MSQRAGPLAHLRVLECTVFAQGPAATALMCQLGANVVKIEAPGAGEAGRRLTHVDPGLSTFFEAYNRGKRSVALDLQATGGRDTFLRLLEGVDVFLHNFRPGAMERLGLGYEDVATQYPRLIYAEGSGLGAHGPDAGRPIVDLLGQARGGLISVTGTETPVPAGVIISDYLGGVHLFGGVLAALEQRHHTGRGQRVRASMLGALLSAQRWELTHHLWTDTEPRRAGTGHVLLSGLYGVYPTSDGAIAMSGLTADRFERFAAAIGRPEWHAADWYGPAGPLPERLVELREQVCEALRGLSVTEVLGYLEALDVRCERVRGYTELATDEQVRANGYLERVEHPRRGSVDVVGSPISFSETDLASGPAAPALGEHTDEVLGESGFTDEEIASLRAAGVVA